MAEKLLGSPRSYSAGRLAISVVVPTFRRPMTLLRCLEALKAQSRQPDEVLVTVRDVDTETHEALQAYAALPLRLRVVNVATPGVVAAQSAALAEARGDIYALTDDDAAPRPEWLERIEAHFMADPHLAGVGGRDWLNDESLNQRSEVVGKVQWYGRLIGNHHIGVGPAREVDVLKGVNCAYRVAALRQVGFDTRLRGDGAQIHWELHLGLALRRAGGKLLYDPAIEVDHYEAPRFDADQRCRFNAYAHRNVVHNETVALMEHLSIPGKAAFLLWAGLIGTWATPGALQIPRLMLTKGWTAVPLWLATVSGRIAGLRTLAASHRS